MSAEGLRAAAWIRRVQPGRAAVLAAELRNAITPAACARDDETCSREDMAEACDWTVRHVIQIVDALVAEEAAERAKRAKAPTCGPCAHLVLDSDPYRCRRHGMVPLRMVDGKLRRFEGCTGPEAQQ